MCNYSSLLDAFDGDYVVGFKAPAPSRGTKKKGSKSAPECSQPANKVGPTPEQSGPKENPPKPWHSIAHASFSPDSDHVLMVDSSRRIHIFNTVNAELLRTIRVPAPAGGGGADAASIPAGASAVVDAGAVPPEQPNGEKKTAAAMAVDEGLVKGTVATAGKEKSAAGEDRAGGEEVGATKVENRFSTFSPFPRAIWNPSRAMVMISNADEMMWWV